MLSFFPRDVLDEIWDLIESISEGFLSTLTCLFGSCLANNVYDGCMWNLIVLVLIIAYLLLWIFYVLFVSLSVIDRQFVMLM